MKAWGSRLRPPVTVCAAVAGVVAAHVIDYVLVYTDPSRRAEVLAASGHHYWTVAIALAGLAASLSAVWAAQRGARHHGARRGLSLPPVRLGRLVPVQLSLFTAVEVTERAAAHAPVSAFLHSSELRLGLALQVALALLLVAALRLVEQLGSDLAAPAVDLRRHQRRPGRRMAPAGPPPPPSPAGSGAPARASLPLAIERACRA